jgi:hypothetical protein
VLALSLAPTRASAQPATSEPWAVEAVVSGSADSHGFDDPFLFDVQAQALREGLDIIVRPSHRRPAATGHRDVSCRCASGAIRVPLRLTPASSRRSA